MYGQTYIKKDFDELKDSSSSSEALAYFIPVNATKANLDGHKDGFKCNISSVQF